MSVDKDKSEQFFKSKILSMIERCDDKNYPIFSNFLTSSELELAKSVVHSNKQVIFYGGHEHVSRVLLGAFPNFMETHTEMFPIDVIKVSFHKKFGENLSHSDFLGSLMGLSIKRDTVGDIVIDNEQGVAYLFVLSNVCEYILQELTLVGRQAVVAEKSTAVNVYIEQQFTEIKGFVSSPRLDCVVALLCNKSRTKAQEMIMTAVVLVNGKEIVKSDFIIKEQDVIVIKKYGKFILENMHMTKKERFLMHILKYK